MTDENNFIICSNYKYFELNNNIIDIYQGRIEV